jgi:uncharacterized protein
VDSTLLAWAAHRVLGDRALCVTLRGQFTPAADLASATALAATLGLRHRVVEVDVLAEPEVVANPPERCYHCKRLDFTALADLARTEGLPFVMDGTNADDQRATDRPGLRALLELRVRSPLAETGLTKADVRRLSRAAGLPTWNRPAAPCLASRIPFGVPVTLERLVQIEAAETALRALGLDEVRVRHEGATARIEVEPRRFRRVLANREAVVAAVRCAGFRFVSLDLQGFRSGSLWEAVRGTP